MNTVKRYRVEGEVFTLGKKLHVYDTNEEEVALVQQKLLSIMPRFYVFVNGEKTAEILKEFSFLKPRYHIFGKNWTVEGDFLAHDYTIMEQGNEIWIQIAVLMHHLEQETDNDKESDL